MPGEQQGERRRSREGHGTGRTSRRSSSSGREGGRERTGRNVISNESARVSHGEAPVEDGGGSFAVDGLFTSRPNDSTGGGVELVGGGYNHRKTVPEPPPYHDDSDTPVNLEPQLPGPSSSFSVASRSTAPASTVPERNGGTHRPAAAGAGPTVVPEDPAYLVTDTYPYTYNQFDRQEEDRLLGVDISGLASMTELPLMDEHSGKQIQLSSGAETALQKWDVECAGKHLGAIKDSVASHDDLYSFTLMGGEEPVKLLDLAGVENAPGLFEDVSQRCRVAFTNKNRLVFTQAKHSAEVGIPKLRFPMSLCACVQDRWSRRKWSSFYAAINATEILQVFVQQTLTTSYQRSNCTFNDVFDVLCCPMGGTMYSEKDLIHATQTLGDHDPRSCLSKWDKTRFMRHALVIRYVDCSSHTVMQTVAMAHPATPASSIFMMARLIESNITIRTEDWLKSKNLPTPLAPAPFDNEPPPPPLFQRSSYRSTIFVLFVVALIFFAIDTTAAVIMLLSVMVAFFGSYTSSKSRRRVTRRAMSGVTSMLLQGVGVPSKTVIGTNGGGLAVYLIVFLRNLPS
eukprot:g16096.t1